MKTARIVDNIYLTILVLGGDILLYTGLYFSQLLEVSLGLGLICGAVLSLVWRRDDE